MHTGNICIELIQAQVVIPSRTVCFIYFQTPTSLHPPLPSSLGKDMLSGPPCNLHVSVYVVGICSHEVNHVQTSTYVHTWTKEEKDEEEEEKKIEGWYVKCGSECWLTQRHKVNSFLLATAREESYYRQYERSGSSVFPSQGDPSHELAFILSLRAQAIKNLPVVFISTRSPKIP